MACMLWIVDFQGNWTFEVVPHILSTLKNTDSFATLIEHEVWRATSPCCELLIQYHWMKHFSGLPIIIKPGAYLYVYRQLQLWCLEAVELFANAPMNGLN